MRILILIIITFLSIIDGYSQHTSGTIVMKMSAFEMEGMSEDQGEESTNSFDNIRMYIHFKPDHQVTHTSMMGIMENRQHYKDGRMITYIDMMDQKIKLTHDLSDLSIHGISDSMLVKMNDMYEIEYDQNDVKMIAGFQCYKASVSVDFSEFLDEQSVQQPELNGLKEMNMVLYITKDIPVQQFYVQQFSGMELEGMPLEMTIDMNMGKMTYSAIDFIKDVDPKVFEAPEGEYVEISQEDLTEYGLGN